MNTQATEQETNLGQSQRITDKNTCTQCHRSFETERGLKIHQGKKCLKKMQCRSTDHKTCSRPTQDANHSGRVNGTAETSAKRPVETGGTVGKPKVAWPAAKEKASYRNFEEKVCKKIYKMKGSIQERLKQLSNAIYQEGVEIFGCESGKKKNKTKKHGESRREKEMKKLRKEKNSLRKRWRKATTDEKEGLTVLYENLKKRCRETERNIRRNERRKESRRTRERFLKNPYAATKKMFTESKSGRLNCSKAELDNHIRETYSDPLREEPLPPMKGLKHPATPGVKFQLGDLKEKELDNFVKKSRAKSSPGGDGVSYKVYKYCDRLRHKLFLLLRELWRDGGIVDDWCRAEGIYLPKEANAEAIGDFRPISILNVDGKIYMGILARRTVEYLQRNGFINESVQKAGIPGIPGCVEHASSIWDIIQEAKKTEGDLNVVWLDLANAYGSVPHELLFKAMDFFHIPEKIKNVMRNYYNKFRMRFTTENFTTDWHRLEVGIGAGCTISVIWFVLVMEMILRSADCSEELAKVRSPKKAFMDDVTLLTQDQKTMQAVLSRLDELITWSRMRFKAKKSRSLTFVKGRQKQVKFRIAGEVIPTVKEKPVKSLGRWYAGTLSDKGRGVEVTTQAEEGLKKIDESKLPGKYKIWCLQFGLYPRLSWPLLIYEIALSRVEIIERLCNVHIRKWLGLPRMTNNTALYRGKGALQLPLTSIVEIYKAGKVRTVMMLRDSKDPEIRNNPPEVITAKKWKAEKETDAIIEDLRHRDIVGAVQNDRKGIGSDPFKPFSTMNERERRTAVSSRVKSLEAERRDVHLIQCSHQGQVVRWEENVVERKLSWSEIWNWNTSRLSFLVRSTYDVLPSPTNLVRWKISNDNRCRCGKRGTLKHILSNCEKALERYTWRHNEVLKIIHRVTEKQIEKINAGKRPRVAVKRQRISFVRPSQQSQYKQTRLTRDDERWAGSWEVAADLTGSERFFPIPTPKKPDIVVWSAERKIVYLVELTVPHEDNIEAAHIRKDDRYEKLLKECEEAGWEASHFSVEVGCRGFIGERLRKWFKTIGLSNPEISITTKEIQHTVEKASHWIWLKREDDSWLEKK